MLTSTTIEEKTYNETRQKNFKFCSKHNDVGDIDRRGDNSNTLSLFDHKINAITHFFFKFQTCIEITLELVSCVGKRESLILLQSDDNCVSNSLVCSLIAE